MAEVLENANLDLINQMFDLANQEAARGNLAGALNLERQAQLLGNSGRNISGFITPTLATMQNAGRVRNSFYNSNRVHGLSTGGVSLSGGGSSSFAGRSLTRSSQRRRSGRNRNPMGRNDKLSVRLKKQRIAQNMRLDNEFGFDVSKFTGLDVSLSGIIPRRLDSVPVQYKQRVLASMYARRKASFENTESEQRRRIEAFRSVTEGATMSEALGLLNIGFGTDRFATFDASIEFKNKIQNVIQARNFFRGKDVDFDGMEKDGVSGLLNIREFGYRELNEQLAFKGEEQFQTVGT